MNDKYEWKLPHQTTTAKVNDGLYILGLNTPWTLQDRILPFSQPCRDYDNLGHHILLNCLGENYNLSDCGKKSSLYSGPVDLTINFGLLFANGGQNIANCYLSSGEFKLGDVRQSFSSVQGVEIGGLEEFLNKINELLSIHLTNSESPYSPKYLRDFIVRSNLPQSVQQKIRCFTQ